MESKAEGSFSLELYTKAAEGVNKGGTRMFMRSAKRIEDELNRISTRLIENDEDKNGSRMNDFKMGVIVDGISMLLFMVRHGLHWLMLLCGFWAGIITSALLK